MNSLGLKAVAALRVVLGLGFLYAGYEKLAAGGFSAAGFLTNGTAGSLPDSAKGAIVNPTHEFWVALGGNTTLLPLINAAVVFGELAIGAALIVGLLTRLAGVAGALMMALFTVAAYSFANGIFNETFMYASVAVFLVVANAGRIYGLDGIVMPELDHRLRSSSRGRLTDRRMQPRIASASADAFLTGQLASWLHRRPAKDASGVLPQVKDAPSVV